MTTAQISDAKRKRIYMVLFFALMVTMTGVGIIAPFLPIYAEQVGASGFMIGLIFGGFSVARLFTMPFFGNWSDRTARKPFIMVGFLVYAAVSIGFIFSSSPWHLFAVRAIQGVSAAMILPIAMAYVGEIAEEKHEARSMNWINISMFIGFGFGPLCGGFITHYGSIDDNFIALGIASFLAFLVVLFFLPDYRFNKANKNGEFISPRYRDILKNNSMRGIFAFRMANAVGRGSIMAFLPLLAADKLQLTSLQIGILISSNITLSGLLQIYFARIADKYSRKKMVIIGNTIGSVTLVMLTVAHGFYELLFINLFMGVAGSISIPAASGMVVTEGRKYTMGKVMALFNIAMSLGLASGPIFGGLIRDISNINNVFYFSSTVTLCGTFAFIYFLRKPTV